MKTDVTALQERGGEGEKQEGTAGGGEGEEEERGGESIHHCPHSKGFVSACVFVFFLIWVGASIAGASMQLAGVVVNIGERGGEERGGGDAEGRGCTQLRAVEREGEGHESNMQREEGACVQVTPVAPRNASGVSSPFLMIPKPGTRNPNPKPETRLGFLSLLMICVVLAMAIGADNLRQSLEDVQVWLPNPNPQPSTLNPKC
jgi:hypothetical protein